MNRMRDIGWGADGFDLDKLRRQSEDAAARGRANTGRCLQAKYSAANSALRFALGLYLHGLDADAAVAARIAIEATYDYFLGEWQDLAPTGDFGELPPNREFWKTCLGNWEDVFIDSLAWAAYLGDAQVAEELSAAITPQLLCERFPIGDDQCWLITFSAIIRDVDLETPNLKSLHNRLVVSRRKREKTLLAMAMAIRQGSDSEVDVATADCLKHFRLVVAKKFDLTCRIWYDVTALLGYARHRGRQIDIPDNCRRHLILAPGQ